MIEKEEIKFELQTVYMTDITFDLATEALQDLLAMAEIETNDVMFAAAEAQLFYLKDAIEDFSFPTTEIGDRLNTSSDFPLSHTQSIERIFSRALSIVSIVDTIAPRALGELGQIEVSDESIIKLIRKQKHNDQYSPSQREVDERREKFENRIDYIKDRVANCPEDENIMGLKKSLINELMEFAQQEKRNRERQLH